MTEEASFEPADRLIITSLETLRVFADPLRQQMLDLLRDAPQTVKQIAAHLHIQPTKLYYHVNLLDEHQLIRVTETRVVSGIIEKQYRAAARRFEIQRSLLLPDATSNADERLDAALNAILNPVRDEVHRSVSDGRIDNHDDAPAHRKLFLRRASARLAPDQADAFYARLEALIAEFEAQTVSNQQAYRLLFGFFPVDDI